MRRLLPYDYGDLLFRILFSLIFLALGAEHLFSDQLIQNMMPDWLPFHRACSILAGLILISGGVSILLGYHTHLGASLLAGFLIVVTLMIHLPALFSEPQSLPESWRWLWQVYQRSNFVKNLCLLGVCFHLLNHQPGRFSLDSFRKKRNEEREKRIG